MRIPRPSSDSPYGTQVTSVACMCSRIIVPTSTAAHIIIAAKTRATIQIAITAKSSLT
jgi:hypothetical protein